MKYEVLGMMFEGGARREVSLWSFVLLRGPLCNSCCMKEKGGKMEDWKNGKVEECYQVGPSSLGNFGWLCGTLR